MPRLRHFLLALPLVSGSLLADALPEVSPMLPALEGPLAVATSNLTLSGNIAPDDMQPYLDGDRNLFGKTSYINDALATQKGVLSFSVSVPDDAQTFGASAGETVPVTGMVFYPTNVKNARPDYKVPAKVFASEDVILEHMQVSDDVQPSSSRYPLVLFSHGFGAHPLYDAHFLQQLASQGFVVVALFHGDKRFEDFAEMQSLRAYGLIEAVKQLKTSPWQHLPDYSRTGVIGVSFGGSVALALSGAQLNAYRGLALPKQLVTLRSVIGMVPATTYRGGAKWDFSNLTLDPLLIMAEKDESVELAPALALIDGNKDYSPDVIMLREEGHFVSDAKWHIARQLVLLKLRSALHDDQEAGTTLGNIIRTGDFAEIQVVRRAD